MKKPTIRIGLCGFGSMGKTHAYAIRSLPFFVSELPFEAKIVGVAASRIESAQKAAEQFDIPFATDDVNALIASPDVDVIDVCTPNLFHAEAIRAALAANKHIYCEKPLCDNAQDARALAALAEKSQNICTVVFNNRHLSPVLCAKRLIDEGKLGRLLSFDFSYLHSSCLDLNKPRGWKQDAEICGKGGVLYDLGSHAIDLAVYLCGEFASVIGKGQIAYPQRLGAKGTTITTNSPEAFRILAETKCGAQGTITASKINTGTNDDLKFEIYGERGALRFSLMNPNFLEYYDAEGASGTTGFAKLECVGRYPSPAGSFPSPKAPQGWLRGHTMSMYHFLNAVHTGKQNSPTFKEAAYVQDIMDAALLSAEIGKEVRIKS